MSLCISTELLRRFRHEVQHSSIDIAVQSDETTEIIRVLLGWVTVPIYSSAPFAKNLFVWNNSLDKICGVGVTTTPGLQQLISSNHIRSKS